MLTGAAPQSHPQMVATVTSPNGEMDSKEEEVRYRKEEQEEKEEEGDKEIMS